MINYWDKLFGEMYNKAIMLKDEKTKTLMSRIALVPKEIKTWVLKLFVWKCRNLH